MRGEVNSARARVSVCTEGFSGNVKCQERTRCLFILYFLVVSHVPLFCDLHRQISNETGEPLPLDIDITLHQDESTE